MALMLLDDITQPGLVRLSVITLMAQTKAVSRQRRWQWKQKALGRCVLCGKPRELKGDGSLYAYHCRNHRLQYNRYMKQQARAKALTTRVETRKELEP